MPPHQSGVVQRSSPESVSFWALCATIIAGLVVVIPYSTMSAVSSKTFILGAGVLVSLALAILARLSRGNIILPPGKLLAALWLPLIAYVLSALFSAVPFASTMWGSVLENDTVGVMLLVTVLGTLTALVLRRSEHYHSFLRVGAIVLGGVALIQVLILLIGQVAPNTISPSFSLLGTLDDLAMFMGLGVISILLTFRFLELTQKASRALLAIGVLALFILAVVNMPVVWILIALTALGLFVEAVMQRGPNAADTDLDDVVALGDTASGKTEKSHSLIMPLVVLAVSLFFLIGGALSGALAQALHVNNISVRPSWQSTFAVAQKTYATSPFFGSGPGTFGVEWLKHRDASLNTTQFWNIDFSTGIGFIPTSLVTTGGFGALAWIAFLALLVVAGLRMVILRAPSDPFVRYTAILTYIGSLYLLVLSVVAFPTIAVLGLTFALVGLFISTTRFASGSQQWGVIFSRSPRLGFIIVFSLTIVLLSSVVAAYALTERALAIREYSQAATVYVTGNLDAAEKSAQRSIAFTPTVAAYDLQANIAMARLSEIVSSTTMPAATARQEFQAALSTGINAALTATRVNPNDYRSWLSLGSLYAQGVPLNITGAYDSAKTAYQKALALSPTNPQIWYLLAQLDVSNKDVKAAQEDLKSAIALKQDYTSAIFLLSQLEVQAGNVKDALTSALAAAYFTPNDPNILFQVGVLYAVQDDLKNAAAALSAAVAANSQFANARYFLAAVYAKMSDMPSAIAQLKAIAAISPENAKAVASQITDLEAGKNPFPAGLLSVTPPSENQ